MAGAASPRSGASAFANLLGSVALVSLAQLLLKLAMLWLPEIPAADWLARAFDPDVLPALALIGVGAAAYAVSMYLWLRALGGLPLSLVYPLLSLSFLVVYFAAALLPGLEEPITPLRLAGVALIVLGNAAVAWNPRS